MIPTFLVYLEKLPLTVNGKLAKENLPEPACIDIEHYVPPRNELEQQACEIGADLLKLPAAKIVIRDDLFKLGGDSIIGIQLTNDIRIKLGLNVSIKDVFTYTTIERFFENIICTSSMNNTNFQAEQGVLTGELSLLPIQEWFFENNFRELGYWNQSFMVKTPILDVDRLKICVDKLVNFHDAFLIRFQKITPLAYKDGCINDLSLLGYSIIARPKMKN
jgi:acyl carrier protein